MTRSERWLASEVPQTEPHLTAAGLLVRKKLRDVLGGHILLPVMVELDSRQSARASFGHELVWDDEDDLAGLTVIQTDACSLPDRRESFHCGDLYPSLTEASKTAYARGHSAAQ